MFALWCVTLVALVGQEAAPKAKSPNIVTAPPAKTADSTDAKEKLEALKKEMPRLLKKVGLIHEYTEADLAELSPEVRKVFPLTKTECDLKVCCRTAPNRAKVGFAYRERNFINGKECAFPRQGTFIVWLQFFDGVWTTTTREVTGDLKVDPNPLEKKALDALMLDIDEAAGRVGKTATPARR